MLLNIILASHMQKGGPNEGTDKYDMMSNYYQTVTAMQPKYATVRTAKFPSISSTSSY